MTPQERAELLDALIDGSISDADMLRIEAELSVDSQVREEYYRRLHLDALLAEVHSENDTPTAAKDEALPTDTVLDAGDPQSNWRATLVMGVLLGIAASVPIFLTLNGFSPASNPSDAVATTTAESVATGFAVLNGQSKAQWKDQRVNVGELLPTGTLHLTSGSIQLELFSGVQMVIEGDARFSIDSPMQVTMLLGRAQAHVPEPAQGFIIKTASGDIVDLGTEFSVNVDEAGADIQVVEGEVELRSKAERSKLIQEGMAFRMKESGEIVQDDDQAASQLLGPQEFRNLLDAQLSERIQQWEATVESLGTDPRLVGHYLFSPDQRRVRQLNNLARSNASPVASTGAIVAAELAVDRWGRSGSALDFSPTGSRVRVSVPGKLNGLSLVCWVKINSLDRWYNSLFLTDGHEDFEPHWQIMDDGRIFFSVKLPNHTDQKKQKVYYSPSIWDASLSGRWIMLGVTYDVQNERVTHYLNGTPLSREAIPAEALIDEIQIGNASIGNWSEPMYRSDATFVIRNLNGSMDEFALFQGALSDDEIQSLYLSGNPNES